MRISIKILLYQNALENKPKLIKDKMKFITGVKI